jgi:acetyl-CoA carboxylase / biotin carboxylase 1
MDLPVSPDENTVYTILKEMVLKVHEFVGVRMHRLSVCEWEVKLWLGGDGVASGAWRVLVTNVTGHTCTVHVSSLKNSHILVLVST